MDVLIYHNDRIVAVEHARLSPGQAGLLTGWGVFTTLRLYAGQPFAFERHWARLLRDRARLRVPLAYEPETVRHAICMLARTNRRAEGAARLSVVRNRGGLWTHPDDQPLTDLLIFTKELVPGPPALRLYVQSGVIFSASQFAGLKMLSWAPNAVMYEEARREGFDEVLLLNENRQLVECTTGNIFLVIEGQVLTPPLSSGCLPGITREVLLEIASGVGIRLLEEDLTVADLARAQEVFLSSSTREIAPVSFISPNMEYPAAGPVTKELQQAFRQYVDAYLRRCPQWQAP